MNSIYKLISTALLLFIPLQAIALEGNTSTGSFQYAQSSENWDNFAWNWSGYDDQNILVDFDIPYSTNGSMMFRMSYPKRGESFVTMLGILSQSSTTGTTFTGILPRTNMPPVRNYSAEFVYEENDSYKSVAKGEVGVHWSLFQGTNAASWTNIVVTYKLTNSISITESDPIFTRWLATNAYSAVEDAIARTGVYANAVAITNLQISVASNDVDIASLQSTVVTSVVCSGQTYNESFFTLSYSPSLDSAATNESNVISTNLDTVLRTYTLDVTTFQSIPTISVLANRATNSITVTATNESSASVDANGIVSFTATNGTATAVIALGSFSRTTNLSAQTSYGTTNTIALTGVTGSYRQAICAWVDARTVSGLDKSVYSTYDGANTNYVRNTNCWAYNADLTCASPWNSTGGAYRAGTLITPQHIVYATHYPLPVGTVMHFVDMTNSVEVRTVAAVSNNIITDIGIAVLDSALPTNRFTPAAILASTYTSSIPAVSWASYGLPVVTLDRAEVASCRLLNPLTRSATYSIPSLTNRYAYYDAVDGGDSGNPTMIITSNSAPVVISTWSTVSGGSSLSYYATQIQTAINALGGTATNLTYADLSEYNTY